MRISIIASLGILIVSFQNCSKASFSSSGGGLLTKLEVLVPVDETVDPDDPSQDDETSPPKHESHGSCNQSAGDLVACILDGPGQSVKLGIMSEKLDGVNSVAESVCVTREACLDLVPAAFKVKAAVARGYCGHNPNVRVLTDVEVKALLGI